MKVKWITIVLLVAVTATVCYLFGLFSRYNYLTAYWDKWHNNIRIVTYGKPYTAYHWRSVVARQMGFNMKNISGCMISSTDIAGAEGYNAVMNNALCEKLGKEWRKRLNDKADSLYILNVDKYVISAVLRIDYVKYLKHLCDSLKPNSFFLMIRHYPKNDCLHPNVIVCRHEKDHRVALAYYCINPFSFIGRRILY